MWKLEYDSCVFPHPDLLKSRDLYLLSYKVSISASWSFSLKPQLFFPADIFLDSSTLVASKVTRPSVQQRDSAAAAKVIKDPTPPPQRDDDLVLVASPSNPSQQDFAPTRVCQGAFQALLFFGSMQLFHQCEPSHQPLLLPVVPGQEMLHDL